MNRAAAEYATDGLVSSDLQMQLAAEGYALSALEADIERMGATL